MSSPIKLIRSPIVCVEILGRNKSEALAEMVSAVSERFEDFPSKAALESLHARERLSTTGIGEGLAIPHCRMNELNEIHLAIGHSREGLDFDSLDQKPVQLVTLIAGPDSMATDLLKILAAISRVLKEPANREFLAANDDPQRVSDFLDANCHMA